MQTLIERTLYPDLCHQVDAGISRDEMERHIRFLCEKIGIRMPGTPGEQRGAEYCADVLRDLGVEVEIEQVSYLAWASEGTRVEMLSPHPEPVPATWFGHTIPTPPDGILAPAVYVGMENDEDWSRAAGRIAIVGRTVTTSPGRRDLIGRAHSAGAVGYLEFVTAIPPDVPKVGNAASFLTGRHEPLTPADLPPLPAASIAMNAAERIRGLIAQGMTVELRLVVGPKNGSLQVWRTSPNVIGTVPGTDLAEEIVYVMGHHDANVIGAHDNASGAAAVLAMARWLRESGHRPRRTIRLFLPGCEQFGLIGSTMHVNQNPAVMARTVFAMDWGAIGDGDAMWVDRTPDTATLFEHILRSTRYPERIPTITQAPAVASDHAAFLWRAGIPACELHFREFRYLFTVYDDPAHIDMERARATAVLGILAALGFADQEVLPLDFVGCAAELDRTLQELSHYDPGLYRRSELDAAVAGLRAAAVEVNRRVVRSSGASSPPGVNAALRKAARLLDGRLTGEFKLLPALKRRLSDHAEVSALARRLPRRLVERGDILGEVVAEREALVTAIDEEAATLAATLNEAAGALKAVAE